MTCHRLIKGKGIYLRVNRGGTGVIEQGLEARVKQRLQVFDAGRIDRIAKLIQKFTPLSCGNACFVAAALEPRGKPFAVVLGQDQFS